MCKENTTTILHKMSESVSGWDGAIYDAEQRIGQVKRRLAELKAVLALYKERRESGEPWPGEKDEQSEAQT